jgi:YbbR-like protein
MASRNFILHNFGWKLLSLLLAGLAWLTIETNFQRDEIKKQDSRISPVITVSQRNFPAVPLALLTPAGGTNRFKVSPLTVSVELRGGAEDLSRLELADIEALVDVANVTDEMKVTRKIRVNVPRDFEVVSIDPRDAVVERITGPK